MYNIPDIVNKIHCADCIEFMKQMPDNSIALTVTSPPYNIGVDYDVSPDNLSMGEYREWLIDICREVLRVTAIGGRFCLNIGNRVNTLNGMGDSLDTLDLIVEIKKLGWTAREAITWVKTRAPDNPQNFCGSDTAWGSWMSASNPVCRSYSEYIFVFHKQNWKKEPVGVSDITKKEFMDYTRNVWYFPAETQRMGHPAPFPKELPYRCIKLYSYVNDLIFDPFMGSGTTALVSQETKRRFIGVENCQRYVDIGKQRLSQKLLNFQ